MPDGMMPGADRRFRRERRPFSWFFPSRTGKVVVLLVFGFGVGLMLAAWLTGALR